MFLSFFNIPGILRVIWALLTLRAGPAGWDKWCIQSTKFKRASARSLGEHRRHLFPTMPQIPPALHPQEPPHRRGVPEKADWRETSVWKQASKWRMTSSPSALLKSGYTLPSRGYTGQDSQGCFQACNGRRPRYIPHPAPNFLNCHIQNLWKGSY